MTCPTKTSDEYFESGLIWNLSIHSTSQQLEEADDTHFTYEAAEARAVEKLTTRTQL